MVEKERLKLIHEYAIKCRLPESKNEEVKEFKVIAKNLRRIMNSDF